MPHNLTNLVNSKVVPGLYRQYSIGSTTAWMENNARRLGAVYRGGKYVYFTEMTVEGMANYDRQLGYVNGDVAGEKRQYEMTQDRGRRFPIDVIDNDETNGLLAVGNVLSTYMNDWVIPELDCYRYSKLYKDVQTNDGALVDSTAIKAASITDLLVDDIAAIQDRVGTVPLVIIMSGLVQKYFGREWIHNLDYVTMQSGEVKTKVRGVDGNPFLIVPSARLKTAYTFLDGKTAGQETGGFLAAGGAKDMKWIITPADGPMAIMKQDKVRVFDPDTNQQANGWAVDHRVYHDMWMLPNGLKNTFIRTGDITTV